MTSEIVASADYSFGRMVGETATVPAGLSDGVTGSRAGYEFRARAPDIRDDPKDVPPEHIVTGANIRILADRSQATVSAEATMCTSA